MKRLFGSLFGDRDKPAPAAGSAEVSAPEVGQAVADSTPASPVPEPAAAASSASDGDGPAPAGTMPAVRPPDSMECPWCSAFIPEGSARCPKCGAALIEDDTPRERGIPGVTTIAPELIDYQRRAALNADKKKKTSLRSLLVGQPDPMFADTSPQNVDVRVLAPPSAEVRAAMERLDREIAGGGVVDFRAVPDSDPAAAPVQPPASPASPVQPPADQEPSDPDRAPGA